MNKKITRTISVLGLITSQQVFAADYPYSLPANMTATVNVTTAAQETYNNKLLGTNIFGFTSSTEQNLINKFDPITVRFPHGLWANWYDWETDTTRVFGTETFQFTLPNGSTRTQTLDHLTEIKQFEANNTKVGIDGLTILNSDKATNTGQGYDMLWTFNMSKDGTNFNNGSPQTIAHYEDLIDRGFEVKSIELGNENFYPGQRSSIIPETEDYIKRAKSMSAALKAKDADIKVSIPLLRRGNAANPDWNIDLTQDQSYFDAVTVHTYVGSNPDDASTSDEAYGTALTARYHLAASVNDYARQVAPNKPVWLSEWGVKSGGPNAVSVLGMADAYVYMSENQDIYQRANWFSVNGKLNSFLVWEDYVSPSGVIRQRIKYPLEKTAVGSSYEIIRSVFENSTLLATTMTSPDLISGVDAVSASVVVKNDETSVFVINLTNKSVPFDVQLDGSSYNGSFLHKALSFTWMGQEQVLPIDTDPLTVIKDGSGTITLPKFSMSKILLRDANVQITEFDVSVTSPSANSSFLLGDNIQLSADALTNTSSIQQVNFRINGLFYKQDNTAPYSLTWTPTEAGTYTIDAVAIKTDNSRKTSLSHTVIVNPIGNTYVHLSKTNKNNFALDGGNGATTNQNVKLWSTSLTNVNQQWQEVSRGANYYSYKKRDSQFCLDAGSSGANNQNVRLMPCDHTDQNQHFEKVSRGNNNYQLIKRNATGFSIDGGTGGENGQNVKLWQTKDTASSNQVWTFTSVN